VKAKYNKQYMPIPSGESYVETESKDEICVPADGKSMARIIRLLSDTEVVVQCLWCGKYFDTYLCRISISRGKYCSKSCLGRANGAQRCIDGKGLLISDIVIGNKNPNWQGGELVDCEICGQPFWKYPSRKTATCSKECGYKRATLVKKGELVSLGHRSDYTGEYHWERIRNKVLGRDNYTCQNSECNLYSPYNTAILHVHHIVSLLDGGENKEENLITLCKNCHTNEHRHDRIR
jgi:5-methylcytosine-specific restriction endonuclease McrA